MLCVNCKKNQATKTYEQIKKGKRETSYYCLECYHKFFLDSEENDEERLSACPHCGLTVSEFKKRNLVGCAYCYRALKHVVHPATVKFQGSELHKGKTPFEGTGEKERLEYELRTIIHKCTAEGNFKRAKECEERLIKLQNGEEEEYVWQHLPLSKQS